VSRRRRAHERVRGMNEVPQAPSESAGEGVAQWCPDVMRSYRSYRNQIGMGGEGVAERSVRVSRDRRIHTTTVVHVLGRVWLSGVRESRSRIVHTEIG